MSSSFSARKLIPKKLEEDLANLPRYKPLARKEVPGMPAGGQKTVREVMDDSIERAMYDEILGPLVNPRSKSSVAHRNIIVSPTADRSRSAGENVINSGAGSSGLFKPRDKLSNNGSTSASTSNLHSNSPKAGEGEHSSAWDGKFSEPDDTRSRSSRTPHGSSFNGSILARLTSVEMENKDLTRQVAIKDARILEL